MSRGLLLATAAAVVLALSGCAAPPIESDTSDALRQRVQAVTAAAAGEDWATATAELDALAAEVESAADAGRISDERHRSLTATIELVAADLADATAVAAAEAAAEAAAAEQAAEEAANPPGPDKPPGNGNGKGPKKP